MQSVINLYYCFYLFMANIMANIPEGVIHDDELDAIDSYFECVTACSVNEDNSVCVTHCVETHLKEN